MDTRWLLVGALVIGAFLLLILLVPFFVNADTFRPTIEAQLSNALGRSVTIGRVSFSLMHASLVADDLAISDDPAFSNVPFVQARKLDVGIEVIPFVLHRQVHITGITIESPSIQLIQHDGGKWNYSNLGLVGTQSSPSQQQAFIPGLAIGQLRIANGSALVSSIPQTARPFEYTDVNLTVKDFSFLKSFPVELSARLPGGGTVHLAGNVGPISQGDTSQTPFHAKLEVREFDPVAAGVVDQSKGILMVDDIDADVTSDGTNVSSSGKIKASRLQLAPKGSPAQEPVDIDYFVSQNLATREGIVSDVVIHAGSAVIHAQGTFKPAAEGTMLNLHLSAPALPIEQLERLLPVVGIRLPTGSSLQGGTLTAKLDITGPATAATMAGPVEIDNTRLAGYDLGSSISGINALTGTSDGTDIRVLRASVSSSPQGTRISEIYGEMPQLGTATGDGTVAPSGEINFRLTAKLNGSGPNAKPVVLASRTIPLTITGTATSPNIRATAGAMVR